MKCKKCNGELEKNARFCRFCGQKVEEENFVTAPICANKISYEPEIPENPAEEISVHTEETEEDLPLQDEEPAAQGSSRLKEILADKTTHMIIALIIILILLCLIVSTLIRIISNSKDSANPGNVPGDALLTGDQEVPYETFDTDDFHQNSDTVTEIDPLPNTDADPVYTQPAETTFNDTEKAKTNDAHPGTQYETQESDVTIIPNENNKIAIAYGGLRMRDKPDVATGAKVGLIPNGTIITIIKTESNWAYIFYDGIYGWCSCDFLFEPYDYSGTPISKAKISHTEGIALSTEKHNTPKDFYTIIPYGSTVYVYKINSQSAFVQYNSIYGWCSTEYLVFSPLDGE